MDVAHRQEIERRIIETAVTSILAAGMSIAVHDGEEQFPRTTDKATIMSQLFSVDEEKLGAFDAAGTYQGMVHLVYGNDGYDVIANYSLSLSELLAPANVLADEIEAAET